MRMTGVVGGTNAWPTLTVSHEQASDESSACAAGADLIDFTDEATRRSRALQHHIRSLHSSSITPAPSHSSLAHSYSYGALSAQFFSYASGVGHRQVYERREHSCEPVVPARSSPSSPLRGARLPSPLRYPHPGVHTNDAGITQAKSVSSIAGSESTDLESSYATAELDLIDFGGRDVVYKNGDSESVLVLFDPVLNRSVTPEPVHTRLTAADVANADFENTTVRDSTRSAPVSVINPTFDPTRFSSTLAGPSAAVLSESTDAGDLIVPSSSASKQRSFHDVFCWIADMRVVPRSPATQEALIALSRKLNVIVKEAGVLHCYEIADRLDRNFPVPVAVSSRLVNAFFVTGEDVSLYKFTCDLRSTLDTVLENIMCNHQALAGRDALKNPKLKIFRRNEFLDIESRLVDYLYVRDCVKFLRDIDIEIVDVFDLVPSRPPARNPSWVHEPCCPPKFTKDSVEVQLDYFKQTINKVLEAMKMVNDDILKSHREHLKQNTKLICKSIGSAEPVEFRRCLDRFGHAVDDLLKHREGASTSMSRASLVDKVNEQLFILANYIETLLHAYCIAADTDWSVTSRPHSFSDVTSEPVSPRCVRRSTNGVADGLLFKMESIHNLPIEWELEGYKFFHVSCKIRYGWTKLRCSRRLDPRRINDVRKYAVAKDRSLLTPTIWLDEWVEFDEPIQICELPREATLVFSLSGFREAEVEAPLNDVEDGNSAGPRFVRRVLGCATLPLFQRDGFLRHSLQLVNVQLVDRGVAQLNMYGPHRYGHGDSRNPVLLVNIPSYYSGIVFEPQQERYQLVSRRFEDLPEDEQMFFDEIATNPTALYDDFHKDDRDILWSKAEYLTSRPAMLPFVLASAPSWAWSFLPKIYALLDAWEPMETGQALVLLLPKFPDQIVRSRVVEWLRSRPTEESAWFLPQLVQSLRSEPYDDSPLAEHLLTCAKRSLKFRTKLYWLLQVEREAAGWFSCRAKWLQAALQWFTDPRDTLFRPQHVLVDGLDGIASWLKTSCSGKQLSSRQTDELRSKFTELNTTLTTAPTTSTTPHTANGVGSRVALPVRPTEPLVRLNIDGCTYFKSFTLPPTVEIVTEHNTVWALLYKQGMPDLSDPHSPKDDLRQDAFVIQMMFLLELIWIKEELHLPVLTFQCLPTAPGRGLVEIVKESATLRDIQVEDKGLPGLIDEKVIYNYLKRQTTSTLEHESAIMNFTHSCVAWTIGSYLLGLGDRHNDNIMVHRRGYMFHIDFGKYLGDAQKFGSFSRDRVPFVLTKEMVFVINHGRADGAAEHFQHFVNLCCKAYNAARKHTSLILNCMHLLVHAGIPGLDQDAIKFVHDLLRPKWSDDDAETIFNSLIDRSKTSIFPTVNNMIHALAVAVAGGGGRSGSVADPDHLSFVQADSAALDTERPVIAASLEKTIKRKDADGNNKRYVYKIHVFRDNEKVPSVVYREFDEFFEFYIKMNAKFPEAPLPPISTGAGSGRFRTNVRTVAEARALEMRSYLFALFYDMMAPELTNCRLVREFFHPQVRDQEDHVDVEEVQHTDHVEPVTRARVMIRTHYSKNERLSVFVDSVSGLPSRHLETYVKVCLYRGVYRIDETKRKTDIRKSANPSFKCKLLDYDLRVYGDLDLLTLGVELWSTRGLPLPVPNAQAAEAEPIPIQALRQPSEQSLSLELHWIRHHG